MFEWKITCALVKKDLLFNRGVIAGSLFFLLAWSVIAWVELKFTELLDVDGFIFAIALAAFGMMPTIYACKKENTPSTKQFMASLPVSKKNIFVSKFLALIISALLTSGLLGCVTKVLGLGFSFHYIIFGMAISICFGAAYILINYMRDFQVAQCFFVGIFVIAVLFEQYGGVRISSLSVFKNSGILALTVGILIFISCCVIHILVKGANGDERNIKG